MTRRQHNPKRWSQEPNNLLGLRGPTSGEGDAEDAYFSAVRFPSDDHAGGSQLTSAEGGSGSPWMWTLLGAGEALAFAPVTASLSNSVTDEVHRLCKPTAATLSAAGVAPSSDGLAEEAGMDSEPSEDELNAFLRPPFATDGATVWD